MKCSFTFFLLSVVSISAFATPVAASERPNIIVIMVDDMGYADLSCFGGTGVQTENLDRLASEGIRFKQHYVTSPICSPSRVGFTTGQYPHRWRITSFLNNREDNNKRGMAQWLDPQAPILARQLQHAGYATGHFGKWHMGGQRDGNDAPEISKYGFEQSLTNFEGMGNKLLPLTLTPDSKEPGRIWQAAENLGGPFKWMQRSEITGGFVSAAIGFINESVASDRPFFVNLWPDDPHSPFFPPLDRWGDGDKRSLYYGVIDAMDEQLAPLIDRIRNDQKLRDNTLILFCSDNGHEVGAGQSGPLRGSKTWLYDGGIRSPLIVWGPGLLGKNTANTINEESVFSTLDINRSLYTLAGADLPEGYTLDGDDLLDTLLGKSKQSRRAPLFFRRPPDRPGNHPKWGMGDNPDLAIRDGKWKFLINYDGSDSQLYDIVNDPSESRNLVSEFPEVAAALKGAVFQWNATMPIDAGDPSYKPDPNNLEPSEMNHLPNQSQRRKQALTIQRNNKPNCT
jgi:arylsulfatase A-like enzyme